jgi:hypothetical protein
LQPSHFNKESGRLDFHVTIRPSETGAHEPRPLCIARALIYDGPDSVGMGMNNAV